MPGFWTGGSWALARGFRAEFKRIRKAISAAETLPERERLNQQLEEKRATYHKIRKGSGRVLF